MTANAWTVIRAELASTHSPGFASVTSLRRARAGPAVFKDLRKKLTVKADMSEIVEMLWAKAQEQP